MDYLALSLVYVVTQHTSWVRPPSSAHPLVWILGRLKLALTTISSHWQSSPCNANTLFLYLSIWENLAGRVFNLRDIGSYLLPAFLSMTTGTTSISSELQQYRVSSSRGSLRPPYDLPSRSCSLLLLKIPLRCSPKSQASLRASLLTFPRSHSFLLLQTRK